MLQHQSWTLSGEGDPRKIGSCSPAEIRKTLAAVLKAARCEIYTDVDGVYTADPRMEPKARKMGEISYDEMLELASTGAKVMQARSVEFAKKFGVVFEVRSSFHRTRGTMVKAEARSMERVVVRGVSLEKNQAKVTLAGVADRPGVAAPHLRVKAEGQEFPGAMVLIGNGRHYGGPFRFFPKADMADGKLDVCIFPKSGPLDLLWYLQGVLIGGPESLPEVKYLQTPALTVEANEKVALEVDGEYGGETPVTFRLEKKGVEVIVP